MMKNGMTKEEMIAKIYEVIGKEDSAPIPE